MRHLIPTLALALAGCLGTCPEPTPPTDAGPSTTDAAATVEPGTVGAAFACSMLLDHIYTGATFWPCDPTPECPWEGWEGPGHPEPRCNPEAVEACLGAADGANNCAELTAALAGCDPEACR